MRFNGDEKHFENEAFRKPDDFTLIIVDNREIYVTEFSSSINPKWPEIDGRVFFDGNVDGNSRCLFRVKHLFKISPV